MRRITLAIVSLAIFAGPGLAQVPTPEVAPGGKPNANPCSDEVSVSLRKLRKSSWFRMDTHMITENGPTSMQIDYVPAAPSAWTTRLCRRGSIPTPFWSI